MEFQEDKIPEFLDNFDSIKERIRNFPGCRHLRLLRDLNDPCIFFTYSHWEEDRDLQAYRKSELFAGVWATTKPLFRSRAQAWSVNELSNLE